MKQSNKVILESISDLRKELAEKYLNDSPRSEIDDLLLRLLNLYACLDVEELKKVS